MRLALSDATSVTIEIESSPAFVPCSILTLLVTVPCVPPILLLDPHVFLIAWQFQQIDSSVRLSRRQKTACSETITVLSPAVTLVHVEAVDALDLQDRPILKHRLVVHTANGETICSLWQECSGDHLEVMAERVNTLIPAEIRNAVVLPPAPPASIPALQAMDRGALCSSSSKYVVPVAQAEEVMDGKPVADAVLSSPIDEDWRHVPLSKIIARIKVELGLQDHADSMVQVVQQACRQLGVQESGVVKHDAVQAAKQLGLTCESFASP